MAGGLKKEFSEKDLSRIRNLITGKYGDKTKSSVGFEQVNKQYVEGDIWEDKGKTWTIKDGIKQTISKLDSMKKLFQFPIACPCCKKSMKANDLNKKMFIIHNKCANCVIEEETRLKISGGFEKYSNDLMDKNKLSALTELEDIMESYMNSSDNTFINENGDEEKWEGGSVDMDFILQMKEKIKKERDKQEN